MPLAPRSQAPSAKRFTTLPAEQTGIVVENNYSDPKMWAEHYQEITYGAIGTGVAVGDYDDDGRPDLFVVSKTETSRLFRNLGGWKFEDVTTEAGLAGSGGWTSTVRNWVGLGDETSTDSPEHWKQGAVFADVNNDGRLDLYVCRFGAPNRLYMNQGDGTFKEEAASRGLAIADASGMAAFCDYDRDGWLDVYLQTNMLSAGKGPNGQPDFLFRNRRDGTFEDVSIRAGITGEGCGHSVTWWDYDQDGWPDLYVANDFAVADKLYRNNRDGTFTDVIHEVVPHMAHYSMGSDFGDVNNDGWIDFFVADMAASSHERDQRGMAGSRAQGQKLPDDPAHAPQVMRNALFVNTGKGVMLEAALLAGIAATDWTWSVRFEDLDNDGLLDLHVTNGMNREYHNLDLLDRIMGVESLDEPRRIMRASPRMAETNFAWRNRGDLQFEHVAAAWGLDHKGVSFGTAFADFDGDGDLDLVYGNYEAGPTVLRNDSAEGHRVVIALRGAQSNRHGIGAMVTLETPAGVQVRQLATARGYLSSSEAIAHFGLGEANRIERLTIAWPSGHQQTFENLAVDQRFTVAEPKGAARITAPEPAVPPPAFADVSRAIGFAVVTRDSDDKAEVPAFTPVRFDRRGPALALGDLNGDGRDDIVMGGTADEPARVLFKTGNGSFGPPRPLGTVGTTDDGPILIFDAEGDGDADVLVTKAGNALSGEYRPVLLHNDGQGNFAAESGALPSFSVSAGAAAAADFNRDGSIDIFIGARVSPGRYPSAPRSALWVNEGGRFVDATETLATGLREIGMVTSALWTDVDDDGWLDLLVALEWGGVRYWRNQEGRGFEERSQAAGFAAAGTGWWSSLAAGDFNGDGRMDYVAGNLGLNTPYRASNEEPAVLFHGEVAGARGAQVIEGYYEHGKLYPRRTRAELGARIPAVLRKYPRTDPYARATLAEIFGETPLARAQRFVATELRSGVFLSQPDGKHRFTPLPRVLQIAPLQGVVTGDFDADGRMDIYAVQNSYAPVASLGRFDGGLSQWLRGDGRGGFAAVAPADSNLIVRGDAKALAIVDLDDNGWPDVLLTRNGAASMAYRNPGFGAERSPLRVTLRGPAPHATGVGAKITVVHASGAMQTTEIHAGSGYYSQSSACAFFGAGTSDPIRRIRVRWPHGQVSEQPLRDVDRDSGTVVVQP